MTLLEEIHEQLQFKHVELYINIFIMHLRIENKIFLTIGLFLLLTSNLFAQEINKDKIQGDWYLSNTSFLEFSDSLILQKSLSGNSFTIWSFKTSNSLIVSAGSIRGNNINAKCFSSVLHYKWMLLSNKNQPDNLRVSMADKSYLFRINFINDKTLILFRIKGL